MLVITFIMYDVLYLEQGVGEGIVFLVNSINWNFRLHVKSMSAFLKYNFSDIRWIQKINNNLYFIFIRGCDDGNAAQMMYLLMSKSCHCSAPKGLKTILTFYI